MQYPAGFTPQFPRVIDSTMRADFVSCPQKFYQAYILKKSLSGESVHLTAGAAYARGLEVVRKLVWGPEKLKLDDAIAEAIPYVVAEYGSLEPGENHSHKSCENIIRALVAYFDRFPPHSDHVQPYYKKNGEPACEFTFSIPLGIPHPDTGEPMLYAGRFDMVGIYTGTYWVVDDKTATMLGDSWARSWRLRAQLTGYCFAARQYGIPVQGAIIRGISLLKSRAFGFSEPIEHRSSFHIERWWVQLHRDVARMIACWQDRDDDHPYGYWDYDLAEACTSFGGCPFLSLCTVSKPDEWDSAYEYRNWNPLDLNPAGKSLIVPQFAS